jgi:hypothetical protein
MLYPRDAPRILLLARENSKLRLRVLRDGHRPSKMRRAILLEIDRLHP